MLPLRDGHLRLILLTHLVTRLEQGGQDELLTAGIDPEQLDRLRALSISDIHRLAALRQLVIALVLDPAALQTALRSLAVIKEAQSMEQYFIRHGASPAMMAALFTMPYKTTLERRRAAGLGRGRGRPALPPIEKRDEIHRLWADLTHLDLRQRYQRLHQAFPSLSLHTLSLVVTEFEEER
jgi:hypothetical protein